MYNTYDAKILSLEIAARLDNIFGINATWINANWWRGNFPTNGIKRDTVARVSDWGKLTRLWHRNKISLENGVTENRGWYYANMKYKNPRRQRKKKIEKNCGIYADVAIRGRIFTSWKYSVQRIKLFWLLFKT